MKRFEDSEEKGQEREMRKGESGEGWVLSFSENHKHFFLCIIKSQTQLMKVHICLLFPKKLGH